jgi:hypothetical protein
MLSIKLKVEVAVIWDVSPSEVPEVLGADPPVTFAASLLSGGTEELLLRKNRRNMFEAAVGFVKIGFWQQENGEGGGEELVYGEDVLMKPASCWEGQFTSHAHLHCKCTRGERKEN